MRNILAIARRELSAYFATPVGWLALSAFLLITGFFFTALVSLYSMQSAEQAFSPYGAPDMNLNEYLVAPFFGNTAIILLFIVPALTMRLFAEDRKTRALELLLTSPITTTEIVLGKFLGAMGFIAVMLACTLHYIGILFYLGDPDIGVVVSSYLAMFLLSGAFVSVGLVTSSFTENQVVSLVLGFVMLLLLWVLGWAEASTSGLAAEVIGFASLINRMEDLTKGLIHTRDVAYYLSFISFFLFATHQRVEAYRWS
ncbi:MAG: Inner rane transport permease YbhR [Pseudomonadota bacterium]|jgi:ABC-2 type transport system permease protein